jgi:hypothetical protein
VRLGNGTEMDTAFHFHAATMSATDLFCCSFQWLPAAQVRSPRVVVVRTPFILQRDRYRSLFICRHSCLQARRPERNSKRNASRAISLLSGAYFDQTTSLRLCGGGCNFTCRADLCAVVYRGNTGGESRSSHGFNSRNINSGGLLAI